MNFLPLAFILTVLFFSTCPAQQKEVVHIYDPQADAAHDLDAAIARAGAGQKHVLVQVGGNWCPWCIKLDKLFNTNDTIRTFIEKNFVFVLINYSKENRNLPVLERLGYPQRFGFPVLIVLDAAGARLHTQDSGFLEEGKGHSAEKILTFLRNWTPAALAPAQYLN